MSTLTQARPGTAAPPRLLSVPLAVTFLAEFTSLTSFFLLLSVMPMLAAAAGAGSSAAGLMTGSLLLGTVAAEAVAAGRDQAVRLPDGARGRGGAARRAGPGHARPRAPGGHGQRQPGPRVRLRPVRRDHRRAHRPAAAARAAWRGPRAARPGLRRPRDHRAAGRCAGWPGTTWPPRPRRSRPRPAWCRWRRSAGCRAGARCAARTPQATDLTNRTDLTDSTDHTDRKAPTAPPPASPLGSRAAAASGWRAARCGCR